MRQPRRPRHGAIRSVAGLQICPASGRRAAAVFHRRAPRSVGWPCRALHFGCGRLRKSAPHDNCRPVGSVRVTCGHCDGRNAMAIARRARRPMPAKPLPTERVAAPDQVAIIRIVGELGRTGKTFTASEINDYASAKLGIASWKPALMVGFMSVFGLTELVPSKQRGVYKATPRLIKVSDAWDESPERGIAKLREALAQSWFARATRSRLADGPAQREGLHLQLRRTAKVNGTYSAEIDRLIDLMIEIHMLVEGPDGALRWQRATATDSPQDVTRADTGAATDDTQSEDGLDDEVPTGPVGEPERDATQPEEAQSPTDPELEDAFTGSMSPLLTLRLAPLGFAALPHETVLRLHRDVRQLLITVQELTDQFPDVAKGCEDPAAISLAELGAMALGDVLKSHQAAHQAARALRQVFPTMRGPRAEQPA